MTPVIISILIVLAIILQIQFNIFVIASKGLPILVYHKVSKTVANRACVTTEQLEQQFKHIVEQQYTCIRLADLLNPDFVYPAKPLLITFDDGYMDNYELLYPLLQKYGLKASIMLAVNYIGRSSEWDGKDAQPLMHYGHLMAMDPKYIEFGLHSYSHVNLTHLQPEEVVADMKICMETLNAQQIAFAPVLAYPYGKFHRNEPAKSIFFKALRDSGVPIGMRIGNNYNRLKFKNPYEVKRISIKGNESFWIFKNKLKKGRVKMF